MGSEEPLVTCDPDVLGGKPVFRNTRIPVLQILRHYYVEKWSVEEIVSEYPSLDPQTVRRVIEEYEKNGGVLRVRFVVR